MSYGWEGFQPNQPPSGYYPPGNSAYPPGSGAPTQGFGFPFSGGAGDGGMGMTPGPGYGPPQAPFGAPQQPFGASQASFAAAQAPFAAAQAPFAAAQAPFGAPQVPFGAPQQPFGAPQQPFGAPQAPFSGSTPAIGSAYADSPSIGFNAIFNRLADLQTAQSAPDNPSPTCPSAPPMPTEEMLAPEPVAAGRKVNIVVVPSRGQENSFTDDSAADILRPKRSGSDIKITRPEDSPSRRSSSPRPNADSAISERRGDSRYQEGLKNMADLMTDVDINDEVIKSLKSKFDLR